MSDINVLNHKTYRQLAKKGYSGAYMIFGEEEFLLDSMVRSTREYITTDKTLAAFNILRFSATEADFDFAALSAAMQSPPMFTDKKLVELHDFDFGAVKSDSVDNVVKELGEIAGLAGSDTIFLLCCRSDEFEFRDYMGRCTQFALKLSEHFTMVDDKCTEGLEVWMVKHFSANKVICDGGLIRAMIDRCGHSMYILSGEIDKLSEYVLADGRNSVTIEDIRLVTAEYTEFGNFDFGDAIANKNYKRARDIFEVKKKEHEAPELILGTLTKVFTDMMLVYELKDGGFDFKELARRTKMSEYPLKKTLKSISKIDRERLMSILDRCAEADIALKRRNGDEYLPIDRLIAECTR